MGLGKRTGVGRRGRVKRLSGRTGGGDSRCEFTEVEEHRFFGATPGSSFWPEGKENVGGGGWGQRRGPGWEGAWLLVMQSGLHPVGPAYFSSFLSWLSAWILEFESWLYHIPALYVPSGKFLTVSVP